MSDAYNNLENYLKQMQSLNASDLFITVGIPLHVKIDGAAQAIDKTILTAPMVESLLFPSMNEKQIAEFRERNECNFAIQLGQHGRFRVNVFRQRLHTGAVIRRIETKIPTVQELSIPTSLLEIVEAKRGLIILVGGTGTGKTSTLAAMIGHRNKTSQGHIITIEDPIEFVHEHEQCIITQREVGVDTESFDIALKNTLRQAPDVILIGEIRTRETMEYAITFAETGHLCLATLHANNANQALDRITGFFPNILHKQLLMDLSLNLKAIIAQQLIPLKSGNGRVPAVEILINTPLVSDKIRKGEIDQLKELIIKGGEQGMVSFDQALFYLHKEGKIDYKTAIKHADSENEVRLMIKMDSGVSEGAGSGLSLQKDY